MWKKLTEFPNSNMLLLLNLIIVIFIIPVMDAYPVAAKFNDIFISTLIFLTVFTIKSHRKKLLGLAVFSIIIKWFPEWSFHGLMEIVSRGYNIIFIIIILIMLIIQIAKSRKVSTDVILESINGYLLLGFVGSIFITLVELFNRGSFSFTNPDSFHLADAIYYSFVTMTTLGFGDINPITDMARSVSIFISVSGQIYLTILVAMLVGKFLAQYPHRES